jgi:diketogulonate reductase-like aldo/keto reductase
LKTGYRLIDTANDYGNEHMIGEALQELFSRGVVKREDLFIQSKLWNANHRLLQVLHPQFSLFYVVGKSDVSQRTLLDTVV